MAEREKEGAREKECDNNNKKANATTCKEVEDEGRKK